MRILWRTTEDGRGISTFIIMIILSDGVWGNGELWGCEGGWGDAVLVLLGRRF